LRFSSFFCKNLKTYVQTLSTTLEYVITHAHTHAREDGQPENRILPAPFQEA